MHVHPSKRQTSLKEGSAAPAPDFRIDRDSFLADRMRELSAEGEELRKEISGALTAIPRLLQTVTQAARVEYQIVTALDTRPCTEGHPLNAWHYFEEWSKSGSPDAGAALRECITGVKVALAGEQRKTIFEGIHAVQHLLGKLLASSSRLPCDQEVLAKFPPLIKGIQYLSGETFFARVENFLEQVSALVEETAGMHEKAASSAGKTISDLDAFFFKGGINRFLACVLQGCEAGVLSSKEFNELAYLELASAFEECGSTPVGIRRALDQLMGHELGATYISPVIREHAASLLKQFLQPRVDLENLIAGPLGLSSVARIAVRWPGDSRVLEETLQVLRNTLQKERMPAGCVKTALAQDPQLLFSPARLRERFGLLEAHIEAFPETIRWPFLTAALQPAQRDLEKALAAQAQEVQRLRNSKDAFSFECAQALYALRDDLTRVLGTRSRELPHELSMVLVFGFVDKETGHNRRAVALGTILDRLRSSDPEFNAKEIGGLVRLVTQLEQLGVLVTTKGKSGETLYKVSFRALREKLHDEAGATALAAFQQAVSRARPAPQPSACPKVKSPLTRVVSSECRRTADELRQALHNLADQRSSFEAHIVTLEQWERREDSPPSNPLGERYHRAVAQARLQWASRQAPDLLSGQVLGQRKRITPDDLRRIKTGVERNFKQNVYKPAREKVEETLGGLQRLAARLSKAAEIQGILPDWVHDVARDEALQRYNDEALRSLASYVLERMVKEDWLASLRSLGTSEAEQISSANASGEAAA